MTDEELKTQLKAIKADVNLFSLILFICLLLCFVGLALGITKVQTILCEQKAVASCQK